MSPRRIVLSITVLLSLLPFAAGARPQQPPGQGEPPRPSAAESVIHRVDLDGGKPVATATEPAPRVVPTEPVPPEQKPPAEPTKPPRKLHPRLTEWLGARAASEPVLVVIAFEDRVQVPRFPSLEPGSRREDAVNRQALTVAGSLVRGLEEQRAPIYARRQQELAEQYGAKVVETFWLIDAVVAEMPLGRVSALAERGDVVSIVPVDSGEPPPQDPEARNDVDDGRARIVSDPYFNLGLTRGFIGLLDTGLRFTHRQFNTPSTIAFRRDCVNGGANCATGTLNPNDDCWNHGTSAAAILTGNDRAGAPFRGVTAITLDSFKVFPSTFDGGGNCTGGLDAAAAVRGFQSAVAVLDRVIVAEMQGGGGERGAISLAANAAFDAGAVVVAANGNFGSGAGTVAEPANASKVLGVGNFDVITGADIPSQGRGPTADGRFKPDFQTPTNTETASTGCGFGRDCRTGGDDAAFRAFGGTSGAVPYAGGAAALLRDFVARTTGTTNVDPGFVYALMILSGQVPGFDNTRGTGALRLPTDGSLRWGIAFVNDRQTVEVPIDFRAPQGHLDVAIWWPEQGIAALHNDVDVAIVDPANVVRTGSFSVSSVFERARFQGFLLGTWKVQIRGFRVPAGPQRVYVAIHNRATPP